jgi:hypothetical protein
MSGKGRILDAPHLVGTVSASCLAQITPANLDVPVLSQLPPAQLPPSDALEPGPLEVVRLDAPLRGGPFRQ